MMSVWLLEVMSSLKYKIRSHKVNYMFLVHRAGHFTYYTDIYKYSELIIQLSLFTNLFVCGLHGKYHTLVCKLARLAYAAAIY